LQEPVKPTSTLPSRTLFSSELVEIGLFDCPRSHPMFHDSGPIHQFLVVFPRHAVRIRHDGQSDVVATRQIITLYNDGQEYRREMISDYGDQSIWLRFQKPEVVEALLANGRGHINIEETPFIWTHGRCDASTYLLQRQLALSLLGEDSLDFLEITETALHLLHLAVQGTAKGKVRCRGPAQETGTVLRHRQLVARCEALLAAHYHQALTLESIAKRLATSPFHLSRVFTRYAGKSIHQYLLQLRLRAAIDRMIDYPKERLTDIGLEFGFATPSHFSQAFHRHFGVTPSQFRR